MKEHIYMSIYINSLSLLYTRDLAGEAGDTLKVRKGKKDDQGLSRLVMKTDILLSRVIPYKTYLPTQGSREVVIAHAYGNTYLGTQTHVRITYHRIPNAPWVGE